MQLISEPKTVIIAATGLNANKATKVKSKKPKLDKKLSGALVSTELAVETSLKKQIAIPLRVAS